MVSHIRTRITQLEGERFLVLREIDRTYRINDYPPLKEKLLAIEAELKDYNDFLAGKMKLPANVIRENLDLEELKQKEIAAKGACRNIRHYRKHVISIQIIESKIQRNKELFGGIR